MSGAIAVSVRYARQAHRMAMWARQNASRFPHARKFYIAMAARNRKAAAQHMAAARKYKRQAA